MKTKDGVQLDTVLNCGQSGFLLVLVLVLEFPNNPSADENENEDEYVRTVSSCTPKDGRMTEWMDFWMSEEWLAPQIQKSIHPSIQFCPRLSEVKSSRMKMPDRKSVV